MRILITIILLTAAYLVYAQEARPLSCKPFPITDETVVLTTKQPVLMLVHNLSINDLWITHPVSEPSANAGWTSRIQSGKWSAITLDKESFELSCIESRPGHEQQIPCMGSIDICQWDNVKLPEKINGTFWAAEDMTLAALITYLGGRGYELPTS